MHWFQLLASFTILLVFVENGVLQIPYTTKFNSVYCWGDPVLIVNITCKLKPINWDKTLLLMDGDLTSVIRNITLKVLMFKHTGTHYRPYMLNATMNICKALKVGESNPYLKVIFERITRSSNVNHTCPYSGHLKANIYYDSSNIPFIMPFGKFKYEFNFYEGWPVVLFGKVHITVQYRPNRPRI